jgi:hypothetical protein
MNLSLLPDPDEMSWSEWEDEREDLDDDDDDHPSLTAAERNPFMQRRGW